jgi:hypothetical protein
MPEPAGIPVVAIAVTTDGMRSRGAEGAVFVGTVPDNHIYRMLTFWEWLSQLKETYFTFDATQYNALFNEELEKVIARVMDPRSLEAMRGFDWVSYIASWVRHAGFHDRRQVQERSHDIVTKLLLGTLFRGYDPLRHGPMELRFKASVANAVRNMTQKERNRRRYLPSVPIGQEFTPGSVTADELPAKPAQDDEGKVVEGFRKLVRGRLGDLALAVLDVRLEGGETKSLVGCPSLGSPGRWVVKKTVAGIKRLAREFFRGDPEMLRRVERAMEGESETIGKRRAAMAARCPS